MSKVHYHARSLALFVVTLCFASSLHALPIYQDVLPREYFAIDFQFTETPFETTGGADILLANGGSVSNGLLGSTVLLFHEGSLVATFNNPMANTFALFKDPASPYTVWGVPADLTPIFQGGNSRMEFHPIFDPLVDNAFVNYQLVFFGAAQSTGASSFSDTLVVPQIVSANVVAVPSPSTFALVAIGAFGLALMCKRRT
ncbi:MAG: hypothetical protein IPL59_18085 [Candidatus Competibacteraceae bacterium]|nr:hypothetical protein [Candidatus Competibacteraceae bacterium]